MWQLVDDKNNPVSVGATLTSFRGDSATLTGGRPPQHAGSTGRVWTTAGEYFPNVYGLKWISTADES